MEIYSPPTTSRDASIVFCGAAGLGLHTAEETVRRVLARAGWSVFASREYMSRVRGGSNSTLIRVAMEPVRAPLRRIDRLLVISGGLRSNITDNITDETLILAEDAVVGDEIRSLGHQFVDVAFSRIAKELGGERYVSMIASGLALGLFGLGEDCADDLLAQRFRDPELAKNREALRIGRDLGLTASGKKALLPTPEKPSGRILIGGSEAIAIGAANAGCNFISAYPMSPGTGVFTWFAQHAETVGAAVEQAEDEIAAANMTLGASYAGASAMTTTSGGGFDLMSETLSLAGVAETPLVIHLAQRPGPATGLATRTEQADLNLALYAGHGEFPRVIYAPINMESALRLASHSFYTAREFQTPVILLTDQFFVDSSYDITLGDELLGPLPPEIQPADENYLRYAYPQLGECLSPFAVPGNGSGLVVLDSHEHTEDGHITEDDRTRSYMVDKRLSKIMGLCRDAPSLTLVGPEHYHTLIVSWGSTFETTCEAVRQMACDGVAIVATEQLSPLPQQFVELFNERVDVIFVENNATGQFARYVRSEAGVVPDDLILKYDGLPFTVEELIARLDKSIGSICKNRGDS